MSNRARRRPRRALTITHTLSVLGWYADAYRSYLEDAFPPIAPRPTARSRFPRESSSSRSREELQEIAGGEGGAIVCAPTPRGGIICERRSGSRQICTNGGGRRELFANSKRRERRKMRIRACLGRASDEPIPPRCESAYFLRDLHWSEKTDYFPRVERCTILRVYDLQSRKNAKMYTYTHTPRVTLGRHKARGLRAPGSSKHPKRNFYDVELGGKKGEKLR